MGKSIKDKNILGLKLPTDPRWADLAGKNLEEILTDHAWCEQKAASNCISLIVQYPEKTEIIEKLSPVVTEEWGHFRMVLREIKIRGFKLGKQRKDQYVNLLLQYIRKNIHPEIQLVDKLLICALIEARSCERFKMLSHNIEDKNLQKFYYDLMVSEAGHYRLFLDLAKNVRGEKEVMQRWEELLLTEAKIIKSLEIRSDRMH